MEGSGLLGITYRPAMEPFGDREAVLAGFNISPVTAPLYLAQELGIALEKKKNNSLATAISDPTKFMKARDKAIEDAATTAGGAFTQYMQKLIDAGVPYETSRQTATLHAKQIYDAEMSIYEVSNPGYATAIGKKVVDREQKEGVRDLYLQDKEQRRAYKKKVIKKYKAKKAAKGTPPQ